MSRSHDPRSQKRKHEIRERQGLRELAAIREPLLREMERDAPRGGHSRGRPSRGAPPERCCRRPENQMRISPLEARDIARAFREEPRLRGQRGPVLERLEAEVGKLQDTEERQSFDCPLLDGTRCLVHEVAKPIGCLAWNRGREYTKAAWNAFRDRDALNDRTYGPDWKLRVIPLWLRRVFRAAGGPRKDRAPVREGRDQAAGRPGGNRRGASPARGPAPIRARFDEFE